MIQEISPPELQSKLAEQSIILLDIRESEEYALCHIDGSTHIPINEITQRMQELGDAKSVVTICHHGMRSLQVARYLLEVGDFKQILNLSGGVDAWASEIDPTMTRY